MLRVWMLATYDEHGDPQKGIHKDELAAGPEPGN